MYYIFVEKWMFTFYSMHFNVYFSIILYSVLLNISPYNMFVEYSLVNHFKLICCYCCLSTPSLHHGDGVQLLLGIQHCNCCQSQAMHGFELTAYDL